jgi:hypothetical protein
VSGLSSRFEPPVRVAGRCRCLPTMARTTTRPRSTPSRARVLLVALAVPLVAVPALAYLAVSGNGSGARPPLAQGASGGSFHPVAGNFVPDATELESCNGAYGCLEQAFGNIAYNEGPKRALALFEGRIETDPAVERDCHRIVHAIGSAVFARFDGDVARTFAAGSATCASGYYHGILERAFVGISSEAALGSKARSMCLGQGIRRRGFLDYQCRHGLGHGLMIQTGYDLPTALALCGRLGTRWDEVTCTGGVFMENGNTSFGFRSRWLDDEVPLYPCGSVAVRHRRSCYLRASTRVLSLNGNDFELAAGTCESAGRRWARFCFRGLGRDAVVESRYRNLAKTHALCRVAGAYLGECLYGAARTFGDGESFEGLSRAAAFCARASRAVGDDCAGGLGVVVGLLYPTNADRRIACARLLLEYARACVRSAIAEVHPGGNETWG